MPENLIIVGAGGDGRNTAEIVESMPDAWNLVGFLDDDEKKQNVHINGVPVLGKTSDVYKFQKHRFMLLVGNPGNLFIKKRLITNLGLPDKQFATLIHPKATFSKNAIIGNGSVILSGSTVMANAVIGKYCYIASNVNIGHDSIINDYSFIAPLVGIPGNVKIEEGVFLGICSCVRGGVTIGRWSIVGMGSVVTADVPPYHVVAGNPARVLKKLNPSDFELR
jgi:sugar O-acyltransferase (sialic acid O-acetyltransferase NeuD family)